MELVQLVDDLDKKTPAAETMTFVIDGVAYAADFCAENAQGFRAAVEPYRAVARRLGKHKVSPPTPVRPVKSERPAVVKPAAKKSPEVEVPPEWYRESPDDSPEVKAKKKEYRQRVREWAKEHRSLRSTRGALPTEVYRAYEVWAAENGVETGPASVGL